jgi:hypothetical protein
MSKPNQFTVIIGDDAADFDAYLWYLAKTAVPNRLQYCGREEDWDAKVKEAEELIRSMVK